MKDPFKAYKPVWLCRLAGHREALNNSVGHYHSPMGYCKRCFLPVSAELAKDVQELRGLLEAQAAMQDLKRMTK